MELIVLFNMIIDIIFILLPYMLLFSMGVEIYVKNPKNKLNQVTMLLLFSLSIFFLGSFGVTVLPMEQALFVALYIKFLCVFILISLDLYFFSLVSKIKMNRILLHTLCLIPLAGAILIMTGAPWMSVALTDREFWRIEHMSTGLSIMIGAFVIYNFCVIFAFLFIGRRQRRKKMWLFKEQHRIRIMLKGSLLTIIWATPWIALSIISEHFPPENFLNKIPYGIMPAYSILIWAFTIRYAMNKYDLLAKVDRRYELLFAMSTHGISLVNEDGIAVESNPAFRKLLGIPITSNLENGIQLAPFLQGNEHIPLRKLFNESFAQLTFILTELVITNMLGEQRTIEIDTDYIEMDDQILCYLVTRDITDKKSDENNLRKLAYEDTLTGLGNRRLFLERLQEELLDSEGQCIKLAVMMVDLDQFKWINDTLGHSAGDLLLQNIAHRIEQCIPPSAVIARLGGDEFAIYIPIDHVDQAITLAQKIVTSLQNPIILYERSYTITASIGISIGMQDGSNFEVLLSCADTAMYVAKRAGRNQYHLYTPNLNAVAKQHLSLANGLESALSNNEFTLYYQPQFDIQSNRLTGFEALLRWTSPELGPISPAQFIPIAEETGAIFAIGDWVLQEALRQTKCWVDEGYTDILVSVNLSTHQLRDELLEARVADLLQQNGLDPRNLCLEITEGTAIFDNEKSLVICHKLVELGVRLAIDDFGTGYSSLSMLNRFPFNFIKIDRSLIQEIVTNQRDAAVVQLVIELSQRLNMEVVAEGVETAEQLSMLKELGCQVVQGYLTGHPMPNDQVKDFLAKYR
jgi:diguanylate cyclase (GGDEF)-like protein